MIPKDTIDRIFETARIEEVVGDFVSLKKSGSSYKGLSPFTSEKTPSFYVSPAKGIYKCFSSGKGGNVVSFLMEHERMTYPEALRFLADRYGIEIEEEKRSPEQMEQMNEKEGLALVTAYAQKFFFEQLTNSDEGKSVGLSYFRQRGFNDHSIEKFGLGYSPENFSAFTDAALEKGYQRDYLLKSGLTKEKGERLYDFFRGRVIFPIRNVSGKTVGFGARTLKSDKKIAKYYNSPESELYHKSKLLYGIDLAKNKMVQLDECLLTEGYTDVVSLHQAGIENVVASSGTSLTEDQIRLISRYTQNVTILFDGDAAGIKASFRGIDMLLAHGMNVHVIRFPEGEDPDSYARKLSSNELRAFITDQSKDFIAFKTGLLLEDVADDPLKKATLITDIVHSVSLIPDSIKRSVYIQECSRLLHIDEHTLVQELNKKLRGTLKQQHGDAYTPEISIKPAPKVEMPSKDKMAHLEKDLVRLLLTFGPHEIAVEQAVEVEVESVGILKKAGAAKEAEKLIITVAEYLLHELEQDNIAMDSMAYGQIIEEYREFVHKGVFPPVQHYVHHRNQEIGVLVADLMLNPHVLSENWAERHQIYPEIEDDHLDKAVKDIVYRIKLRKVQIMIEEIQTSLEKGNLNEDEVETLIVKKMMLDRAKRELSAYFGSAIIQ